MGNGSIFENYVDGKGQMFGYLTCNCEWSVEDNFKEHDWKSKERVVDRQTLYVYI